MQSFGIYGGKAGFYDFGPPGIVFVFVTISDQAVLLRLILKSYGENTLLLKMIFWKSIVLILPLKRFSSLQ